MRKASPWMLEKGIQTPSPSPDLIPAETSTENLHWDRYIGRGHFTLPTSVLLLLLLGLRRIADGLYRMIRVACTNALPGWGSCCRGILAA